MGNALPALPDIKPDRLKSGKGVVLGLRVPEEDLGVVEALRDYCEKNHFRTSRVIVAAIIEYLKNHGGAR